MISISSSNFSNFNDDFVSSPNLLNVTASVGDLIVVFYHFRRTTVPDPDVLTPSWNGENFTPTGSKKIIGDPLDLQSYLQSFYLYTSSAGTFDVLATFSDSASVGALAGYIVLSGVDQSNIIASSDSEEIFNISGYTTPNLTLTSVASDDIVLEVLAPSYYNSNFDVLTSTVWTTSESQTETFNVAHAFTNLGRLYVATKTGTGNVTVGYTPDVGQPMYVHEAFLIKGGVVAPTEQLFLENTTGTYSVEQTATWDVGQATGTVNGNWLNVLNSTLPSGTPGVPFSFGIHDIRLRLVIDTDTATRLQNYFPPSGYTALEYSSSSSNTTNAFSIWNGLSNLINGDQILVANSQIADDTTPITVSWSASGIGTPSQNKNFTADFVYFDNSNGQLSLLDKSFVAQTAGIANINSGAPLEGGQSFTIALSNINANNVTLVYLEIPNIYKWVLPVDSVINSTTLSCIAPAQLPPNINNITISVKENKALRELSNFSPEDSDEITWINTPQISNFLATSFFGYLADTTNNVLQMSLPATPTFGDKVAYMDLAGTFGTNNFTINPNGNNIHGSPDNYVTSSNNESGVLFYSGATYGWKFLNVNPTI